MQIKDMFRKKIDREIQGVIIVGQGEETNVAQELEEYVVTRELQRHFADFFAAYKKGIQGTTPKMGVWISGFFGSGKSHFLKILSYLLQNKQVGDKHAIDYFIEDQKITNQMVLADMQLAANTPSDVILFNIDSKSDSNGKENKDAIVNVFLKVFNEMQGFCGSMPHLADLERRLSEEGRFEEFKEKFEEEYGDPWESSRQDFDFIQDSVVDVLSDMDFMSESAARNWCEKATESYQISIEDFAKRVKSYIDKKGNNHHVVFLPLCLTRSRRRWERIQPFLTVCIVTFQAGRFRSSVRSISPTTTVLLRITWRSLSENCEKNSMGMRWISISALERT